MFRAAKIFGAVTIGTVAAENVDIEFLREQQWTGTPGRRTLSEHCGLAIRESELRSDAFPSRRLRTSGMTINCKGHDEIETNSIFDDQHSHSQSVVGCIQFCFGVIDANRDDRDGTRSRCLLSENAVAT